jgi:hypothetical protein
MSGQSLMLFVFSVAIAFAANQAEDMIKEPSMRGPASVSGKKIVFEEVSAVKHTAKVHGPVDVSVELVGARPNGAGDVFVLKGVVTSSEAVNNIEYSWRIPEEIEVVNGSLEAVIPSLQPDQPFTVEVTLKQKSFANGRIHFRAKSTTPGMKFADTAQYNSMMQEALEASRAELKRSTEEDFAAQKASGTGAQKKNLQFTDDHSKSGEFKIFH